MMKKAQTNNENNPMEVNEEPSILESINDYYSRN